MQTYLVFNGFDFYWDRESNMQPLNSVLAKNCSKCDIYFIEETHIIYDSKQIEIPIIFKNCWCDPLIKGKI